MRILIMLLAMLVSFLVFADNYSALDGGNWLASVGLAGMVLSPIIYCVVVLIDVFRS